MDKRYDAKRSSQHSERREKLSELMAMGLPEALAKAVASGHMPLNDALEQMAQAAQVERLIAKHGLVRSVAVQVAMGQMDLDTLLQRRRLKSVVEKDVSALACWWGVAWPSRRKKARASSGR